MDPQKEEQEMMAAWKALESLEEITPSPQFRTRLWAQINQLKKGETWQPVPVWASAFGVLLGVLIGVAGGLSLSQTTGPLVRSVTETSVDLFTAPFPQNSIESNFLKQTNLLERP